jgi:hypothetical protein
MLHIDFHGKDKSYNQLIWGDIDIAGDAMEHYFKTED